MRVLVTGGAGFIGSHLARRLVNDGHDVLVIDNLLTGYLERIVDIKDQITFIQGDIGDEKLLADILKGVDYVFHEAALPSVPRSIANPLASNEHNITGTLKLLIACRDAKVKRVIYAASSSVYGNANVAVKSETLPANPLSPYALTKYAGEKYCHLFTSIYSLETICLRYFNVFGPYQDPKSQYAAVIPTFINRMLIGEKPTVFGDGSQSRDFTYVENNVEANILAMQATKGIGESINIALGETTTLIEVINLINQELGTNIQPEFGTPRIGDVAHSKADISKAKQLLGYIPQKSFKEGLKETIEWYKKQKKML